MYFCDKKTNKVYSIEQLMFGSEYEEWCKCFYDICRINLSVLVNTNFHVKPQDWDLIKIFEETLKDAILAFEDFLLTHGYTPSFAYEDGEPIVTYELEKMDPNILLAPLNHIFTYITDEYHQTMGVKGLSEYHTKEV